MEPIEIIYNGYIDGREGIDTAETNEAVGSLMGMIGSLLPNSGRMQDVLCTECLHLAGLFWKQGFIVGFGFALGLFGGDCPGAAKAGGRGMLKGKPEAGRRRHYAYAGPGAGKGKGADGIAE